jgi:hypothetical protein
MASDEKKRRARTAVNESGALRILSKYSPVVVSTIFIDLDTPDSDIDVVCSYDCKNEFVAVFEQVFSTKAEFELNVLGNHVLGRFVQNGFLFEVYASATAVTEQPAYRHFMIMERLSNIGGVKLQEKIKVLKNAGIKTEPAIASLLNLSGDPYMAVLDLENWPDIQIETVLK